MREVNLYNNKMFSVLFIGDSPSISEAVNTLLLEPRVKSVGVVEYGNISTLPVDSRLTVIPDKEIANIIEDPYFPGAYIVDLKGELFYNRLYTRNVVLACKARDSLFVNIKENFNLKDLTVCQNTMETLQEHVYILKDNASYGAQFVNNNIEELIN